MSRPKSTHTGCTVKGCDKPHKSRGLCGAHYAKALRSGSLERVRFPKQCMQQGCERSPLARGLCGPHYREELERRKNQPANKDVAGYCIRCGQLADDQHLRYCRKQPKIIPGDGDPRHGTELGYIHHHCRCRDCTEAARLANKARRHRRGAKERRTTGAHLSQVHVRYLRSFVPLHVVAKTLELSPGGLRYHMYRTTVPVDFEERALSTTVSDVLAQVEPHTKLRKEPYVRIVSELLAAGWTKFGICQEIGYTPPLHILRPESTHIQVRFAHPLQQLHDQAWHHNTNGFRKHCKCIQLAEPETLRNSDQQRRNREAQARHRAKKSA